MGLSIQIVRQGLFLKQRKGLPVMRIARMLGVNYKTLWRAIGNGNETTWKHVGGAETADDNNPSPPTPSEWIARALRIIKAVAQTEEFFTVENVWRELDGQAEPPDRTLMGSAMKVAMSEGWCETTDRSVLIRSMSEASYRRRLAVFRSLIFLPVRPPVRKPRSRPR